MGLDMYLYAKKFVASAKWETEEECAKLKEVANLMNGSDFIMEDEHSVQFAEITLQLAYWRKANQIHRFFIDECGNGKDDGQDIYVCREDLQKLLELCETVMNDKSKAEELLPTRSGFFFGSTEYDEWYYKNLEDTIPVLQKILKDAPEDWEFEYHPSW